VATLENQGRHCTTFIFLTLDFEKKPSLREFLTGSLGEEVFFRGLLGGWLMRRFGLLVGNTLQTLIFLLPHFLILFAGVYLWPLPEEPHAPCKRS
jgi:hypothetical protein